LPSPTAAKSPLVSQHNPCNITWLVNASTYLAKVKINLLPDLFKNIPPLTDTDREKILKLFIRVSEVYDLKLISDMEFMSLLVSKTSGGIMQILGAHLGTTRNWREVRSLIIFTLLPPRLKE
jgi:hypothetical protein